MAAKKSKKVFLSVGISTLIILFAHYFLISKINLNSTIQILIDFVIFWIILWILFKISGVIKKGKNPKKKKTEWKYTLLYLIMIPVLILHYFLISKINVSSTIQVFIDLMLFWVILFIFAFVYLFLFEKRAKKKKN